VKEAEKISINRSGIDAAVENKIQSKRKRWRNIFKRIFDRIKYLIYISIKIVDIFFL